MATLNAPFGVAVDSVGANLYVADSANNIVRTIAVASANVSTLAGGGSVGGVAAGYADGIATAALFNDPVWIAVDPAGLNLFVSDSNYVIRQIAISSANVTSFAGGGSAGGTTSGYADGTGAAALFAQIRGLVVDPTGANLYVADFGNHLIRRVVISSGAVTTFAGGGSVGGTAYGSADGIGTTATFWYPSCVAVDPAGANLFVADTSNNLIRSIVIASAAVATVAGSTSGGGSVDGVGSLAIFNQPYGVAVDSAGLTLFVADNGAHLIRKVAIAAQNVTTLAGSGSPGHADGSGSASSFYSPAGIAFSSGNGGVLFVGDSGNDLVRQIIANSASGDGTVTTLAGGTLVNGIGTAATMRGPAGVAADPAGVNVFVADTMNSLLRQVVITSGAVTTLAGGSNGHANGIGTAASFVFPRGVAVDPAGIYLYVADTGNHAIRQVVIASSSVTTLAGGGSNGARSGHADGIGTAATFFSPHGVAVDPAGTSLYVADYSNNLIRRVLLATASVSTLAGVSSRGHSNGIGTLASFYGPSGVAVDPAGTMLYVADYINNQIRQVEITSRNVTTLAGGPTHGNADGTGTAASFASPAGVAIDPLGASLYVADFYNGLIRQVAIASGAVTTLAGGGSSGNATGIADGVGTLAEFHSPSGLALSPAGAWGFLFVADSFNNALRLVLFPSASPSQTSTGSSSSTSSATSTATFTSTATSTSTASAAATFSSISSTASPTSTSTSSSTGSSSGTATSTTTTTSSASSAAASITGTQTATAPSPSPHCIAAGAPVLLANGSVVSIETLAAGTVVATPKGDIPVIALHGHRLNAIVAKQHVLHFAGGSLGFGLPTSPLTVTDEHGFAHPATGSWTLFKQVKGLSSPWPTGASDADGGLMVYQVALDTDDPRPILVAGLQVASWTRGYPDRADMPVVA